MLPEVGSGAWAGPDGNEPDDEDSIKVRRFFDTFNWDVLAAISSRHRDGMGCSYVDKFSIGQFNMVRRLNFEDGVSWVVRVQLPPEAFPLPLHLHPNPRAYEVEVASMMFLKSKSTIPVPAVFDYNATSTNEAGAPYLLIEYIHGSTAENLRDILDCGPGLFETIEQDAKFREQMAKIQTEMVSTFPQIGCLYYSKETSDFSVGQDLDSGLGPWTTSADYYRDHADHLLKGMAAHGPEVMKGLPSFALPVLLDYLLSIYGENSTGPFRFFNTDFGAHNILVDGDFNIVGIVDFDGVMAVPEEVAAQYPVLSGLDLDAPGIPESSLRAPVLERIKSTRPLLDKYKECLIRCESDLGNGSAVGGRLESTAALAWYAMSLYRSHMKSWNEQWFSWALRVLRDHSETRK